MDQNQMMMEYLMQTAEMQPEQQAIARKQAMVDQLRAGAANTPQMRGGGRGFTTAANPLEFLNNVAQTGLAKQGENQAAAMQDAYGAKRRSNLADLRVKMMPGGVGAGGAVDLNTRVPLGNY